MILHVEPLNSSKDRFVHQFQPLEDKSIIGRRLPRRVEEFSCFFNDHVPSGLVSDPESLIGEKVPIVDKAIVELGIQGALKQASKASGLINAESNAYLPLPLQHIEGLGNELVPRQQRWLHRRN